MINRSEIEARAEDFGIQPVNVERDYVFGWLLVGIYTISHLKDTLILKGGNCFRKAYFENTRFSADLDFSTTSQVNQSLLLDELNKVCDFIQDNAGVIFEKDINRISEKFKIDNERQIYEVRLYFKDFYGKQDHIVIHVRLDITEFDRLYLPVQVRHLIHQYSDSDKCRADIRCVKLEEMLATKLKCLLQRRHSLDLYDFDS